jgi:DNA-binding Xre family transcriptional regulator
MKCQGLIHKLLINNSLSYFYSEIIMTALGVILAKRFINKAQLSRQTGITTNRMNSITTNNNSYLRAEELYLIALALDMEPGDLMKELFKGTKLPKK